MGPIKCWFDNDATHQNNDNWNCMTLNDLRELAEPIYHQDEALLVLRIPSGGFLVMQWYKRRGRVTSINVLASDMPFNLEMAQEIIAGGKQ